MPQSSRWSCQLRTAGETSCSDRDALHGQRHLAASSIAWSRPRGRTLMLARASLEPRTRPLPSIDYVSRLKQYKYGQGGCPLLLLAPMENLADRPFRRAFAATVGGFDEACTEFIRIPGRSENPLGSVRGVSAWYDPRELGSIPLGAQIMGSSPEIMGMAARYMVQVHGAPRVDLNCGCPANTVTGSGAGSSLLRTPRLLGDVVAAMVTGVDGAAPVSVKLRAGYDDPALLEDNLLAAQEAGAAFVTLHPRTRRQAYSGAADWELIGRAVDLLDIPVVGNGDVVSVERAHQLLRETGCQGLMLGRGAVHDPLLFLRIRHSFAAMAAAAAPATSGPVESGEWQGREPELVQDFLLAYARQLIPELGDEARPVPEGRTHGSSGQVLGMGSEDTPSRRRHSTGSCNSGSSAVAAVDVTDSSCGGGGGGGGCASGGGDGGLEGMEGATKTPGQE